MSFLNKLKAKLKPSYVVKLKCSNCGWGGEVNVPTGTTVKEFIKTGSFHCENCKCVSTPDSYETKWLK